MSFPKKGSRLITVDDQVYCWKFKEKIFVGFGEERQGLLIIDFGYYDIWLYAGGPDKPPEYFPKAITPEFVTQGIRFAINHGWKPTENSSAFNVKYRDEEFSVA